MKDMLSNLKEGKTPLLILLTLFVISALAGIIVYTLLYFQAPAKLEHYKAVIMISLSETFLKRPFEYPDFAAFIDIPKLKEKEDLQLSDKYIKSVTEIPRYQYKVGELFYLKTILINTGSYPVSISHGSPLFGMHIFDEEGNMVDLLVYNDEGVLLDGYPRGIELAGILAVIKPGQIYNYCPIPHWVKDEEYRKEVFWVKFSQVGKYQIIAYASFSTFDMKSLSEKKLERRVIKTQSVWIDIVDK